ncbi:MAG: ligase-associated DNA damage response endonuclease PdeM [Winogradskyella sp.]
MNIVKENITIEEQVLTLTNQRAVYWKNQETLILSDIHIGKTAHFRKHGIAVPDQILQDDLDRLNHLIQHFSVKKVLVVGDLFHAERNTNIKTFKIWLNQFSDVEWILIQGNHDKKSNHLINELNISVVRELTIGSFTFIHDNLEFNGNGFTISGHTHPGVVIKGKGKQKLKLPCYQITSQQFVLPAFSLFTGLNTRDIPKDATCYAFTDSSIFKF